MFVLVLMILVQNDQSNNIFSPPLFMRLLPLCDLLSTSS